ncbi:hypothetical protein HGRIS_012017 [Hohenbuehelia grisea]|uniref:Uncharacterized protein n=1 Tax=Hohenbuehelia grisea TaxID=104357 RepID=A0ABR3IP45_9AGAR
MQIDAPRSPSPTVSDFTPGDADTHAQALTALFEQDKYFMFHDHDDAEPIIVEYAPPPRYPPYPGQTSDIPDNIFIYRHPGGSNSTLWLPSPIVKGRAMDNLEPGCYGEDDEMDAAGQAKITPSNYPPPPPDNDIATAATDTNAQPYAGLATITRETFQDSPDPSTNPFTASTRSAPATPEMVVEASRLVTTPPVRNRNEDRPAGPKLVRPPTPFPMSGGRLFRGGHITRDPDIVAPTASHRPLSSAPVPNDMGRVSEVSLLTSYVIRCLTKACALMNKIVTTERADARREDVGLFHFQQRFIETHDINPPHHELWFAYDDILQHIGRMLQSIHRRTFPMFDNSSSGLTERDFMICLNRYGQSVVRPCFGKWIDYAPHLYRVRAAYVDVLDALRELLWVKGYTHSGIRVTHHGAARIQQQKIRRFHTELFSGTYFFADCSVDNPLLYDDELSFLANAAAVFQFQGDTDVADAITRTFYPNPRYSHGIFRLLETGLLAKLSGRPQI